MAATIHYQSKQDRWEDPHGFQSRFFPSFFDEFAFNPEAEAVDHEFNGGLNQGRRDDDAAFWLSGNDRSSSMSSDETDQFRFSFRIEAPSDMKRDSPLMFGIGEGPEETRMLSHVHNPLDPVDSTDLFAFSPQRLTSHSTGATLQNFRTKCELNQPPGELTDTQLKAASDVQFLPDICGPEGNSPVFPTQLSCYDPRERFPSCDPIIAQFDSLFLEENQPDRNEQEQTKIKATESSLLSQALEESQTGNCSAKARKKWIELEEADLWDPDVAAFTMSQELYAGYGNSSEANHKWSFDLDDLYPPRPHHSSLDPALADTDTEVDLRAHPQQMNYSLDHARPQQTYKLPAVDAQSMWLLERLHQQPLSATESPDHSPESSPCSEEHFPLDFSITEELDRQQYSPVLPEREIYCGNFGELKQKNYPLLPSLNDPPYVRCQSCAVVLAVPKTVLPGRKSVQKLRCGACWKISIFSVGQSYPLALNPDPSPEESSTVWRDIQQNKPSREEQTTSASNPVQNSDNPATRSVLEESSLKTGSCKSMDRKTEAAKLTEPKLMHARTLTGNTNSSKTQRVTEPETDSELPASITDKEVQDKYQISSGAEKSQPKSSRSNSVTTITTGPFSEEFLPHSFLLGTALKIPIKATTREPFFRFSSSEKKLRETKAAQKSQKPGRIAKMPSNDRAKPLDRKSDRGSDRFYDRVSDRVLGRNPKKKVATKVSPGSPDFSFVKFSGALSFSAGSTLWGSPFSDLYTRQPPPLPAPSPPHGGQLECAGKDLAKGLLGFFTRSKKAKSPCENVLGCSKEVYVNGEYIPECLVNEAEQLSGPITSGSYWYDIYAGFWGVSGGPCMGIIMPGIEVFDHPLSKHCSGGNTSILINGRELHKLDLRKLVQRGLPSTQGRSYKLFIDGRVFEEASGIEGQGLGKLAPTVEKRGCGYGMSTLFSQ